MSAALRLAIWVWLISGAALGLARADSPADLNVAVPPNAIVQQPRGFGYVIGDVFAQRVLLELQGRAFEPVSLPAAQRVSAWLERREPRIEAEADGRRWLVVEYQLVNAPRALSLIRIPPWSLSGRDHRGELTVGAATIGMAPLIAPSPAAQNAAGDLRPDRPAPRIAERPIVRRMVMLSALLLGVALAWAAWWIWRNARDAAARPFARALREIRRAGENTPEAWRALHRAFDGAAGRVTREATLGDLLDQAPYVAPLEATIREFFEQSSRRFFADAPARTSISVRALCTELRRLEKAHAR